MGALFEKSSYDGYARSGWHIRKNLLERTHYDNQSILFYDFGELVCTCGGETPLNHSGGTAGWVILFVHDGNAAITCNRNRFSVQKNDVFITGPAEDLSIRVKSSGKLEVRRLIMLDSPAIWMQLSHLREERPLHLKEPEKIQSVFQAIESLLHSNLEQPEPTVLRDLAVRIFTLIAEISRQCLDYESKLTIQQIRGEIDCRPWNNYSLSELSRICGLSERRFEQQFREIYGCSYLLYLIGAKIGMACNLLQTTKYSVDEIVKLCNFRSKSYFYRVFKKQTGVTPLGFRGIQQNGEKTTLSRLVMKNRKDALTSNRKHILWLLLRNSRITVSEIAEKLSIHRSAVQKNLEWLKTHHYIRHNGSRRAGSWVILQSGNLQRRGEMRNALQEPSAFPQP